MSKAEEKALKAYPELFSGSIFGPLPVDLNKASREKYQEGYEQAEKDLALTLEDIELLHTFLYAIKNNKQGVFTFTRLSDEQYEEVLRRFRETKDK